MTNFGGYNLCRIKKCFYIKPQNETFLRFTKPKIRSKLADTDTLYLNHSGRVVCNLIYVI